MSNRSLGLDEPLYAYLLEIGVREAEVLRCLREETAKLPEAQMQIAPEQGQFLQWLVRLAGFSRGLEIGVFTGYSSLCLARGLPAAGQLLACDISAEWTAIARRYWQEAGVHERIDLRLAPAQETLDGLLAAGEAGRFDFAFIDADKENYLGYYESCLQLVRPGGLLMIDNTLWSGRPLDAADQHPSTVAIRAFNRHLQADERVDLSVLPLADGLTLARKL